MHIRSWIPRTRQSFCIMSAASSHFRKAIRGCGMGNLAEFWQEVQWCNPEEPMELLPPIEMEAREMVAALLSALPEVFG